jgi:transposase-like protein
MARRSYSSEDRARGLAALAGCGGNLAQAARQSGIPRKTLAGWAQGQSSSPAGLPPPPPDPPPAVAENDSGEWAWTAPREGAARLLAEDALTDDEIAARVGVSPRQLYRWKQRPEFAARVREAAEVIGRAVLRYAVSRRTRRVEDLDNLRSGLLQVIEERGASPHMQAASGGRTGLLVRRLRVIGSRDSAREVEEFEFDAALVRELREVEKQAAQECGQWVERREQTGAALLVLTEVIVDGPGPREGDNP